MAKEGAKLVGESLAEEVYALCEDLFISREMVKKLPKGSPLHCEHTGRIKGIMGRLEELGINRIEERKND